MNLKRCSASITETIFYVGEIDPDTFQREQANLISNCGLQADDTRTRPTRRYFGELAPHIIGYVGQIQPEQVEEYTRKGYPEGALIGQMGIERSYEEYLAGKSGAELKIIAPTGETLRELGQATAEPGLSVYLTIDRELQGCKTRFSKPTTIVAIPGRKHPQAQPPS
jgi:penicillin-binding protein 2